MYSRVICMTATDRFTKKRVHFQSLSLIQKDEQAFKSHVSMLKQLFVLKCARMARGPFDFKITYH